MEPGLLAQLVTGPPPAEHALQKILNLFENNSRMSEHELRVMEIAMEGIGVPAKERRRALEAAIQRRRDRLTALHGWRQGGPDAPT